MVGMMRLCGVPVVSGSATGTALVADVPLSFWGGYDPERGEIIDRRHPLVGSNAAGRVLVLPSGRGSCSGSGVLLEAIQNGVAPAAIVTSRVDPIIALGAILGDELCGSALPVVVVREEERRHIASGDLVTLDDEGVITISRGASHA
jgi:predicted aconitase with swiveling domain